MARTREDLKLMKPRKSEMFPRKRPMKVTSEQSNPTTVEILNTHKPKKIITKSKVKKPKSPKNNEKEDSNTSEEDKPILKKKNRKIRYIEIVTKETINGEITKSLVPLIGTRKEVWRQKAYRTIGGLTKSDLIQRKGRIVSKKASDVAIERHKNKCKNDPEFQTKWNAGKRLIQAKKSSGGKAINKSKDKYEMSIDTLENILLH